MLCVLQLLSSVQKMDCLREETVPVSGRYHIYYHRKSTTNPVYSIYNGLEGLDVQCEAYISIKVIIFYYFL